MRKKLNSTFKFFTIAVNDEAFIAFETLDPSANIQNVEIWATEGSHGLQGLRVTEEDSVEVKELTCEEFRGLTIGEITGYIIDNARYY